MAPERFIGHDVDGRADVYSLACLLHECLTGAPPFSGKDLPALMYAQLYSGPPEASSLVEGIPPALDAVIARGMAKDPKDRFQAAGALAAAAREALLAEAPTPQLMELPPYMDRDYPVQRAPVAASRAPGQTWRSRRVPNRSQQAHPPHRAVPDSPTQTAAADGVDDWDVTRPPENMPPGPSLGPDGSRVPPGVAPDGPARGPAWRRLGVPILIAAAALAVAIVLVVMASPGRKRAALLLGRAPPPGRQRARPRPSHGGGDDTGRADPQLRSGRAERPVRLHHQSRYRRDHRAQHGH